MSFDAVTFSAVQALKLKVGEAMQVPLGYTNSKFIDAGAPFDPIQYPKLALASKPAFNGSNWEKVTIPPFKGAWGATRGYSVLPNNPLASTTTVTTGVTQIGGFTLDGEYFVVFSNRMVARTTGGDPSTLAYFAMLPDLGGNVSTVSSANNKAFVTYTGTTKMLVLTEKTLTTTSQVTMPVTSTRMRYANGTWVAFRMAATNVIYSSTDGVNFTAVTTTATASNVLTGVEYGAGVWVVCTQGTSNNMHSSPDLVSWTARTAGTIGHQRLKWNGSAFAAVAATVGGAFWSSPDGITWTTRTQAQSAAIMNELECTTNGVFVASSGPSETAVFQVQISSDNGVTWVSKTALAPYGTSVFSLGGTARPFGNAIMYCGSWNIFSPFMFGVSLDTLATAPSSFSFDMMQTNIQNPVFKGSVGLVLENNNVCSSTIKGYLTNANFTTWTPMSITAPVPMMWGDVLVTPTRFVVTARPLAVGSALTATGNWYIFTSTDGVNWTYATNTTTTVAVAASVHAVNERISYIGSTYTTSWYSDDYGATAVATNFGAAGSSTIFASGPGKFVGVTFNTVVMSTDGASMATMNSYPSATAYTTRYLTLSSTNCIATVTPSSSPYGQLLHYVSYDGGYNWGVKNFPLMLTAPRVSIVDGWFVAQMSNFSFMTSRDANTWNQYNFPADMAGAWFFSTSGHGNAGRYLAGAPTATLGFFLRPNQTNYFTPALTATVSGMKWVVKAK